MIKIFNKPLLALSALVLFIGIFYSCKKDKDTTSGQVKLLSFGPTGARHGDTIQFIGNNLNLVNEIDFTGTSAVVSKSNFVKQTSDKILAIVPMAAEQGYVTLKTTQGDIVSKTQFNISVASTVTSFTKQARPGENITISGNYLNWVKKVTFSNNKTVESFISKTMDKLVVTVPQDAQTGPLVISYGGTDSMDVRTADTLKVTLPEATSLTPNPVKHKTNLTITGTDLDLVKQILFNGVPDPVTTFVSQSATQIVVNVPESTTKGKISLIASSGVKTQSSVDLDVLLPAITSMSPNPVDAGSDLTITGTNLDLVTSISFVGVLSPIKTFVSQTPTQLVVNVPAKTIKGVITLGVLNSTLPVKSADVLKINGGLPSLDDFPFPIYTDALANGYQDWSYTATHDFNNTDNVRQGTKSILAVYAGKAGDQYQGITFHNPATTAPSISGYTVLEFSVYGDAGTGGKKLNVVINGDYAHVLQQVTVTEGEWSTFSIPISSLGNPATLGELVLQATGWTGTLHVDHVGLR